MKGHKNSSKNDSEKEKSDLTDSGYLVALLQHRAEGGDRNLANAP